MAKIKSVKSMGGKSMSKKIRPAKAKLDYPKVAKAKKPGSVSTKVVAGTGATKMKKKPMKKPSLKMSKKTKMY